MFLFKDATLYDIKVVSRGPDDIVYDRNPAIRAKVINSSWKIKIWFKIQTFFLLKIARGNCILEYKPKKGPSEFDLVIYALRKFTGGLGDEDEIDRNNQDWKKYFLKDLDATKRVAAMKKANGEAAHMSCRFIDGKFFVIAGSKNVHLVFQNRSDIGKYVGERYMVATVIAQSIEKFLSEMDAALRNM